MRTVIDVGAADGTSCIHWMDKDPDNTTIWAFEPRPGAASALFVNSKKFPTYHVVQKAVSDFTGKAKFNVSVQGECSSLNEFAEEIDAVWPGREDLKMAETVEVDVIRLEDFVNEFKIEKIDLLHVDAQGHDLEVLMGLGDKVTIVGSGVIEMARSHTVKLYKDQKYDMNDAIEFLNKNGFRIHSIKPNDIWCNEVNIVFFRP
jgi:FkbM family methyltransferase